MVIKLAVIGDGQLPFGSSEPCPCSYGDAACNNGAEVEGVIAAFWADLNPDVTIAADGEGGAGLRLLKARALKLTPQPRTARSHVRTPCPGSLALRRPPPGRRGRPRGGRRPRRWQRAHPHALRL